MDTPALILQPSTSPILLDTLFLLLLRLVYFLLARKFLLSTLSPTLREISQPETLLPPTSLPLDASRRASRSGLPLSASDLELDTEDDNLLSAVSPNSSVPPSPVGKPLNLPRDPFPRRNTDDNLHALGASANGGIELQSLTQKLKDVGSGVSHRVNVLQLSHGKSGGGGGGTKGIKRATRGLNRVASSRHVNFSVSLHVLLGMILLLVPLVQCLLLTYRTRDATATSTTPSRASSLPLTSRLLISLIPFTLYIFLFTRIPPYITTMPSMTPPLSETTPPSEDDLDPSSTMTLDDAIVSWSTSTPEGWEGGGWLAPSLGRVVVLGVVVLGALSGLGAVRTAWGFIEHAAGSGSRLLSDNDILQAERSLYRVRHDMVGKREDMSRIANQSPNGGESSSGWMGRVFGNGDQGMSFGNGGDVAYVVIETASLQAELRGLQAMERQVARSLSAMKARKRRQGFGQTLRGKAYNVAGYIFAIYCVARVLMCLTSIFFPPLSTSQLPNSSDDAQPEGKGNTNGDWISFLLALGVSHLPTGSFDIDVAVWSRGISLLLTGVLILSSLTQVLRSVSRIVRLTSKTVGAGFLLLGLGQLFATYVISLLVQLRTSIPPSPTIDTDPFSPFYSGSNSTEPLLTSTHSHDSLLSTLPDFRVFGRLFDVVFLMAAGGTAVYRYIAMKVNGADESGEIYDHR
ncbi:hypothetical protein P7C73_g4469, partial [Tremellales sp. Uapishka_1]